jgi:hypothetical protein
MSVIQSQGQIAKHMSLIKGYQEQVSEHIIMGQLYQMFNQDDNDKAQRVIKNKIKYSELHIKHCGYMIKIFEAFIKSTQDNDNQEHWIKVCKVVIPLMKINIQDIEECMRELVEDDIYTEQDYKKHMEGFMGEINAWEGGFRRRGIVF